jgi:hypothetical protein
MDAANTTGMKEAGLSMRTRFVRMGSRLIAALILTAGASGVVVWSEVAAAVSSPPRAPVITAAYAAKAAFSSVELDGFVDPRGAATNYYFQYGKTKGYGAQTPLAPAGNGIVGVRVSRQVAGLEPATTYHFRLVAASPLGIAISADHTFTTPRVPLSLAIVGAPNPVVFGNPFLVEGNLSGTGGGSHEIVLQVNAFPYLGGFKSVGNPEITNAMGGFSFPVLGLLENAQLRVVTVGKPLIYSPVVTETVAVRVSFHVRRAAKHGYVRFYGTVAPAEVGAQVGYQLLQPGKSVNEGGTIVKAGTSAVGRFSGRMRLRHRGLYRALVKVSDGAHVSNYSEPIVVR